MGAHHQATPKVMVERVARVWPNSPDMGRSKWLTALVFRIMIPNFAYRTRHDWFARLGESFLVVSSGGLVMLTDNAETIRTVTLKREQFPKWTAVYSILRQFGENVLTTEGSVWRMHRKVTSASFNERNAALVFREAIAQTQGMLRMWAGPSGSTRKEPLRSLQNDTMKLALNIISYVGFGMRLLWPGETHAAGTDPKIVKYGSHEPSDGHKLSFTDTMEILLKYLLLLLIVPRWILSAFAPHVLYTCVLYVILMRRGL